MPAASTFSRLSRASRGTVRLCAVVWWTLGLLLVAGCSPTKHLSPDELLLERVRLTCDDPHVKPSDYRPYVRQEANTKWFSLAKVPLAIYNLSGSDSTRRWNRFVRRLGEAPVSYDSLLMQQSSAALTAALKSRGYLHAEVRTDTIVKGRKITVNYRMHPGERYYVEAVRYDFDNDTLREAVLRDSLHTLLHKGIPLSATLLSDERNRILRSLRRDGFYHLNKEYLSFSADTARSSCAVTLTLHFRRPEGTTVPDDYHRFRMGSVRLYENVLPLDTGIRHTRYREIDFYHKDRIRIYRRVYNRHIHLRKDSLYREDWVQDTYSALNALSAVNYSTIRFKVSDSIPHALDAAIYVETRKPRTIGFELEGTNTSGNLGAAVALTYGNNNLFGGSENLPVKLRGAYEAIRGLEGYSGQDYVELSGEATPHPREEDPDLIVAVDSLTVNQLELLAKYTPLPDSWHVNVRPIRKTVSDSTIREKIGKTAVNGRKVEGISGWEKHFDQQLSGIPGKYQVFSGSSQKMISKSFQIVKPPVRGQPVILPQTYQELSKNPTERTIQ